jgi:hypothetical protein
MTSELMLWTLVLSVVGGVIAVYLVRLIDWGAPRTWSVVRRLAWPAPAMRLQRIVAMLILSLVVSLAAGTMPAAIVRGS